MAVGQRGCGRLVWVRTRQGAELAAIEAAIRMVALTHRAHVQIVADNMAAICATIRTRGSMSDLERAPMPHQPHPVVVQLEGAAVLGGLPIQSSGPPI